MKIKAIYSVMFMLVMSLGVFAQNDKQAEMIINDFIKSVEQSAIQADFILTVLDEDNDPVQTQNGLFTMKNSKFSLILDDIHVFFDGKTQWTYVAANNEVTITEPSESELAEINPIFILQTYQDKCAIRFSSGNKSNENYAVEMIPNVETDFEKIQVSLNKSTQKPLSIKLIGKKDFSVLIGFSKFRQDMDIPDSAFVFDKNKYKDVFENDHR